jgi:hypothetical protein
MPKGIQLETSKLMLPRKVEERKKKKRDPFIFD